MKTSAYLLAAFLHVVCGVSMAECSVILPWLELMNTHSAAPATILYSADRNKTPQLYSDIRSVMKSLALEVESRRHICCPSCFKLYPAHQVDERSIPDVCKDRKTPTSSQCGARMTRTRTLYGKERRYFIKEVFYYPLKDWVADVLHRPGMEDIMFMTQTHDKGNRGTPQPMEDVFDGQIFRDLKDYRGLPFLGRHGSELRLLFGLSVDAYNPLHNKQAGKKVSSTVISLICYNIPKNRRLLVENMHVLTIVPGPTEPSLSEINHLLSPVVDELGEFWDPGVWYTSTPAYKHGRLVRGGLVPLIVDLKAARQVTGCASHSAKHFCMYCGLKKDEINDIDYHKWEVTTLADHKKYAIAWRDARSEKERAILFENYGVRWSVLLELPYWDLKAFTIVDTMHTSLLGNLHRHCTLVWGMDDRSLDGLAEWIADPVGRTTSPPSEEQMVKARLDLRHAPASKMELLSIKVLRQLCVEKDVLPIARRDHNNRTMLMRKLLEYVRMACGVVSLLIRDIRQRSQCNWFRQEDQETPLEPRPAKGMTPSVPFADLQRLDLELRNVTSEDSGRRLLKARIRDKLFCLLQEKMRQGGKSGEFLRDLGDDPSLCTKKQLVAKLLSIVSYLFHIPTFPKALHSEIIQSYFCRLHLR